MAYNKEVYRINHLGEMIIYDIDILPKNGYIIELTCDECSKIWTSTTNNWLVRKKRSSYIGEICGSCSKSGKRNSRYKKHPHEHKSEEEIQIIKDNLSKLFSGNGNPTTFRLNQISSFMQIRY